MAGNASVFWLSCFELREPWHPLVYNRWNWVRWAMNWSRLHSDQARNDFHRIRDVFNMIPPFENRETNLDHKRIVWSWFIFTGSEFLFLSLICNFLFFVFLHLPNPSLQEPKWKGGGLCGNSPLYSANPVSVGYYLSGGIYTVSVQTVNTQCQWMEVLLQWGASVFIPVKQGNPIYPAKTHTNLNPLNTP